MANAHLADGNNNDPEEGTDNNSSGKLPGRMRPGKMRPGENGKPYRIRKKAGN
jgi:hypothetical protein